MAPLQAIQLPSGACGRARAAGGRTLWLLPCLLTLAIACSVAAGQTPPASRPGLADQSQTGLAEQSRPGLADQSQTGLADQAVAPDTAGLPDQAPMPAELDLRQGVLADGSLLSASWERLETGPTMRLAFRTLDGPRQVEASELVYWGCYQDESRGPRVVLSDGSLLVADFLGMSTTMVTVYSEIFGELALPLEHVRGLILQAPRDPLQRDRLWQRVEQAERGSDRLLLDNGDVLQGVLGPPPAAAADASPPQDLQRRSGEEDRDTIWLTMEGRRPTAIPLGRVRAIIFNPSLIASPTARGQVLEIGWRDGSLLKVENPRATEDWLQLPLAGGEVLECDLPSARDEITLLRPLGERVTYLSRLQPLGYKHIPFLDLPWDYAVNRNVLGGRLRTADCLWTEGLGMHSTSRLAYDLPAGVQWFQAELALDRAAGRRGSVVYRVFAYRDNQWQVAYQSPIIRGGQPPVPIAVDVAGAVRLALIVEFADRGDELDHANWLNARLISPAPASD